MVPEPAETAPVQLTLKMSDSFNGYQAEYEQIKQSIQSKLDNDVKRTQGGRTPPARPSPTPVSDQ
jgi:hypothetical protein